MRMLPRPAHLLKASPLFAKLEHSGQAARGTRKGILFLQTTFDLFVEVK